MKFTKKYGRARMKVAVLDHTISSNLLDIVIGDYVYELQFRVEEGLSNGEPQFIDMDSTVDDDDPNGGKEEDSMDEALLQKTFWETFWFGPRRRVASGPPRLTWAGLPTGQPPWIIR